MWDTKNAMNILLVVFVVLIAIALYCIVNSLLRSKTNSEVDVASEDGATFNHITSPECEYKTRILLQYYSYIH